MKLGIHGREYIRDTKYDIWFRIMAYVGAFVGLIFALNSLNFFLIGLFILPLALLLSSEAVGLKVGRDNEPPAVRRSQVYQSRVSSQQGYSIILGALVAVFIFAAYWLVAPAAFGLPASVFGNLALSSGILTAFGVNAVYSFSEAVAEERFVRFAAVNGVIYLTGSAVFGLSGSVLIFWALHVSRYWNDPQAQGLILVSGAFLGYIDILYRSILVSTIAHVSWNLIVTTGTALVVAAPHALAVTPLPALAFAPAAVAVLAWRRPGLLAHRRALR